MPKILTKNIALKAVCLNDKCNHIKPMNLHEAMYIADKSCVTGELICEECGCVMKINEECNVEN